MVNTIIICILGMKKQGSWSFKDYNWPSSTVCDLLNVTWTVWPCIFTELYALPFLYSTS